MVPWAKPSTKNADEVQDDQQVDRADPAQELPMFTHLPPWSALAAGAGAAQG